MILGWCRQYPTPVHSLADNSFKKLTIKTMYHEIVMLDYNYLHFCRTKHCHIANIHGLRGVSFATTIVWLEDEWNVNICTGGIFCSTVLSRIKDRKFTMTLRNQQINFFTSTAIHMMIDKCRACHTQGSSSGASIGSTTANPGFCMVGKCYAMFLQFTWFLR